MKKLIVTVPAALALVLGGCSSGSSGSGGDSSDSGSDLASCSSLAGKPVGTATGDKLDDFPGCDAGDGATFDEPGSFGCYPDDSETGDQEGSAYYVNDSEAYYVGKPGGDWMKGPAEMSITEMSELVGC